MVTLASVTLKKCGKVLIGEDIQVRAPVASDRDASVRRTTTLRLKLQIIPQSL